MANDSPSEAEEVVAAFGGFTVMSKLTGIPITTIHSWTTSKHQRVPRWWRDKIVSSAAKNAVRLPKRYLRPAEKRAA